MIRAGKLKVKPSCKANIVFSKHVSIQNIVLHVFDFFLSKMLLKLSPPFLDDTRE